MLVLTRKPGEIVDMLLPDGTVIQVIICDAEGSRVRLGIAAPGNVRIVRREINPHEPRRTVIPQP
jgi:carbon storage regulator CsrA